MKEFATKVNMAPQGMAEEAAETTNRKKPIALFDALEGLDSKEIP